MVGGLAASSMYALNSEVPGGVLSNQGSSFVPFPLVAKKIHLQNEGIDGHFNFSVPRIC
jgi:hypothetical protein